MEKNSKTSKEKKISKTTNVEKTDKSKKAEKVNNQKVKKQIWKPILCMILVILFVFLVHAIRNYVIISEIGKKAEQYTSCTNYHIKSVATEGSGAIITINYYTKNNKQVVFLERKADGKTVKNTMYYNGQRYDQFVETEDSKIAKLNQKGTLMSMQLFNALQTDNSWQNFVYGIPAIIRSTNYNGNKCFIVNNFLSPYFMYGEKKNEVYINKDTGLYVKSTMDDENTEREYEFNNVDDSIFVEPDIGQYELQEND